MKNPKSQLRREIDNWINTTQDPDDLLDMYVSDTLVDAMTDAAWNVLQESRNTQEWLKKEGRWDGS